jgi:hypothetical protein
MTFFHLCPEDQREMFPVFRKHAAVLLPAENGSHVVSHLIEQPTGGDANSDLS